MYEAVGGCMRRVGGCMRRWVGVSIDNSHRHQQVNNTINTGYTFIILNIINLKGKRPNEV